MSSGSPPKNTRKRILHSSPVFWAVVKGGISVAIIWLLVERGGVDWERLAQLSVAPEYLFLAFLLVAGQPFLLVLRWVTVLRCFGENIRVTRATCIIFIMHFFNQFLPVLVGGDAMRIWYGTKEGIAIGPVVGSVFMDRVCALLALVLMIGLALPFAGLVIAEEAVRHALALILFLGCFGIFGLLIFQPLYERIFGRERMRWLSFPSRTARAVLFDRRRAPIAIGLSLLVHTLSSLAVYTIVSGFGAEMELGQALILVPPVILAMNLPISLGGWGVREAAMVAGLATIGIGVEKALVVSVTFGLLMMSTSLPGAVVWWLLRAGQDKSLIVPKG